MDRMAFRVLPRPGCARVVVAGIALVVGLTHSQPLSAQFSKYGSSYGSYGGPYRPYKQYDPYDDYDKSPAVEDRGDMVPFKRSGVPLLAVIGLDTQRVSIYDSAGRLIQQSPVSTGTTGYETPAGVFSVVQKKADHNSNLYEDGNMPFMQRITWTGIALHGGVLPGHPASHGCVRLPFDFAERLFDLTDVGMRVIIVPHEITLAEFDHPHLLRSSAARVEAPARPINTSSRAAGDPLQTLRSIASSKASEAEVAQHKASEARRVAIRNSADAASTVKALRGAEAVHDRADTQLKEAEKALEAATSGTPEAIKRAEIAKKAAARLAEADRQLQAAKAHAQAKTDTATASEEAAKAAEEASDVAQDAAAKAKRKTLPISVFVSRKTQRFYVRQGYVPVFEGPITIEDAEKPVGNYVFTAFGNGNERVRWGLVSMYADGNSKVAPEPVAARNTSLKGDARRSIEASPADVAGAKAALDRIAIPQEAIQRITDVVLPGSSLIVSDEGLSIETGKDTDFVIVMSGEPQGALKVRQHAPPAFNTWGGPYRGYGNSPFGSGGFWKW
jgi:L,D-transpeptidase catalytic domain